MCQVQWIFKSLHQPINIQIIVGLVSRTGFPVHNIPLISYPNSIEVHTNWFKATSCSFSNTLIVTVIIWFIFWFIVDKEIFCYSLFSQENFVLNLNLLEFQFVALILRLGFFSFWILIFEHFGPRCSYKNFLVKKSVARNGSTTIKFSFVVLSKENSWATQTVFSYIF